MMRKIEQEMIDVIKSESEKDWTKDNTSVCSHDDCTFRVYLHEHMIAEKIDDELRLSDCGFQTKTTKSRLNCILSHFNLPTISAKKFQWYIGDEEWKGNKVLNLKNGEESKLSA